MSRGRRRTHRALNLADAMVLIAALAIGLALTRLLPGRRFDTAFWRTLFPYYPMTQGYGSGFPFSKLPRGLVLASNMYGLAECLSLPVLLAVIPIRLRRPRPSVKRLLRQPGFAASCAAFAGLVLGAWLCVGWSIAQTNPWFSATAAQAASVAVRLVGPSVFGVWFVLWATGRWRSERSAIDRIGRFCGGFWFAAPFVPLLYPVLHAWAFGF